MKSHTSFLLSGLYQLSIFSRALHFQLADFAIGSQLPYLIAKKSTRKAQDRMALTSWCPCIRYNFTGLVEMLHKTLVFQHDVITTPFYQLVHIRYCTLKNHHSALGKRIVATVVKEVRKLLFHGSSTMKFKLNALFH